MVDFFFYLTMVLFILVCLFLILLVLIQKGRGGGLASAFGGMGGNTAFGSKTGDVLTWATSVVFGVFLVLAVALNLLATNKHELELQRRGFIAAGGAPPRPSTPVTAPPNTTPAPGAGANTAPPPAPATGPASTQPATP
jgi:preprotein translocase subunit SecG